MICQKHITCASAYDAGIGKATARMEVNGV